MELKTFFWLHFWFLSATILLPVYSVEYISCPANCTCVTKEEKYLRLYVQCHDLTLDVAPISTNSSLVHVLDLSRNGIKVLSSCFLKGYDNVVILFLKNSKIESIKSLAFHSLQHLESIDLSYNSFALVPPNLFINNRKLKNVSLNNNELTMLKEDVPILKSSSLLHLDLSNCKLSDLSPSSLYQLPNLLFLDLSGNHLRQLSANALLPLSHLEFINLSKNPWRCSDEFERIVCLQYKISNARSRNLTCSRSHELTKTYGLQDQDELCKGLTSASTSFTTTASTPITLVDVSNNVGNPSYGHAFQEKSTTPLFISEAVSTPNEDSSSENTNSVDGSREIIRSHVMTTLQESKTGGTERPDTVVGSMMTTERSLSHDTEEPHKSGDKTGGTADTTDMVIYCLVLPVIIVLLILLCKCFVRYLQRDISNESVQEHEPFLS